MGKPATHPKTLRRISRWASIEHVQGLLAGRAELNRLAEFVAQKELHVKLLDKQPKAGHNSW